MKCIICILLLMFGAWCWLFSQQLITNKNNYHQPFLNKECKICHNKYNSNTNNYLAIQCLTCHENQKNKMSMFSRHDPFKYGQCTACHFSHNSSYNALLKKPKDEICFDCHANLKSDNYTSSHQESSCLLCHNPHASNRSNLLLADPIVLCTVPCHYDHDNELNHPVGANIFDDISRTSLSCTSTCHNPHGSNFKAQLAINPKDLCFTCHKL